MKQPKHARHLETAFSPPTKSTTPFVTCKCVRTYHFSLFIFNNHNFFSQNWMRVGLYSKILYCSVIDKQEVEIRLTRMLEDATAQ